MGEHQKSLITTAKEYSIKERNKYVGGVEWSEGNKNIVAAIKQKIRKEKNLMWENRLFFQNVNFAMDVYRLVRDELQYELIVRGIDGGTAGTVLSMRKILRDLISKENVGVLVTADSFKPDIDNGISICLLKVNELQDMLGKVQEFSELVALRIEARLHHIIARINRLKLVAADNLVVSSRIKDLVGCVEELKKLFDDKRKAITKSAHEELGLETE
ncbi:hypothetical protein FQA39_LY04905 [Lamprigera yunnana]|nr:hypothetical protein FQA39_LY04905 [Lamprigera yunnana]